MCAEGASKTALKKMRVYADDDYIWMYFEIDETQLKTDVGAVLNVFFNSDNDAATGGNPLDEHLGNASGLLLSAWNVCFLGPDFLAVCRHTWQG